MRTPCAAGYARWHANPHLRTQPAGKEDVLSLETYRGAGKLQAKVRCGCGLRPTLHTLMRTASCPFTASCPSHGKLSVTRAAVLSLDVCALPPQIALITGGDSGIGRAVAVMMAKEGAKGLAIVYTAKEQPVGVLCVCKCVFQD